MTNKITLAIVFLLASTSTAQTPDTGTLSGASKATLLQGRDLVLRSAEKMPEEHYGFKPAPEVRSFGALLGHIADGQYFFCGMTMSEKPPAANVEKTKTAKADLIASLKEAFGYCEKAYNALTETSQTQKVKFLGSERPRLSVLEFNNFHNAEHYGNLVTYMRMKGLVPPSSEPRR
ncbi:MAG: DinB family protein [Bryobacteraceae bacterium]